MTDAEIEDLLSFIEEAAITHSEVRIPESKRALEIAREKLREVFREGDAARRKVNRAHERFRQYASVEDPPYDEEVDCILDMARILEEGS